MTDLPSSPPAAVRREQMLTIILEHGFARVADLSRAFRVSEVTVRSDLEALASGQGVHRVHGGAVASTTASTPAATLPSIGVPAIGTAAIELPFEQSLLTASDEKSRIGRAAAALICSDQAVVLDVGTTTTAVAMAMLARDDLDNVVVITSALNIALALESAIPRFTVVVTGGTLRPLQHSLVDPLAGAVLDQIRADIAFIGCGGVDSLTGITNVNLPEAAVKRRMIAAAARTVVVADSSKLAVAQLSRVAPISEIDTLVTGAEADRHEISLLRAAGVTVIQAGTPAH